MNIYFVKLSGVILVLLTFMSCNPDTEPKVESLKVTDIAANSALGYGKIVIDDGSIRERGFCWDVLENPEITDQRLIEGSGPGKFQVRIYNLQPNTTYYARAYVINRAGLFYGKEISFKTDLGNGNKQIIADHSVVSLYDQIPKNYLDSVKKMLVFLGGESHAQGYQRGLELLARIDPRYKVLTYDGGETHPKYSEDYLRFGQPVALGEQIFTMESKIESIKNRIQLQYERNNPYAIVGFGWCWDMTWVNKPGGTEDPIYHVRWAGSTAGGQDGNKRWGLDKGDSMLTGNRINMDTYLKTVDEINLFCKNNNLATNFIFTTGPVDSNSGSENGFQRELKHDHIRKYVSEDPERILFDYADILIHNKSGEKYVVEWKDNGAIRYHAQIHPDNMMDYDDNFNIIKWSDEDQDHIGEVGALHIAKAMWWLLARIAGWDGNPVSADE